MSTRPTGVTTTDLAHLVTAVARNEAELDDGDRGDFVASELTAVQRALGRLQADHLAPGSVFCEWGSGLGGVCGVATLNGFEASGIEHSPALVDSARGLALQCNLSMTFAQGTFLLPGDQDLAATANVRTQLDFDTAAWDEIGLRPADCAVVFAYPWPGEEAFVDGVFARHASHDALLVTFHDFDRVLVQRKGALHDDLHPIGWM